MIAFITPELVCDTVCENGLNHRYIYVDSSQRVHIVYHKKVGGVWQIFYRMKGTSWENEERITNTIYDAKYPSITAFRDSVFVVWHDYRVGGISNIEIFFNAKPIGSTLWNAETRLTYTNSGGPGDNGYVPTIKEHNGKLFVVWYDYRDDPSSMSAQIYLKVRDSVWNDDIRISNSPSNAWYPSFDFLRDTLLVVWADNRNTSYNIYAYRNHGEERITTNISYYPDISTSGNRNFLVYVNSSVSPPNIYGKIYDVSWLSDFPIRPSSNSQQDPTVVSDKHGGWIVAWSENGDIMGFRIRWDGVITDSFRIYLPGEQSRPTLFVDNFGYIHLAFVDRSVSPTKPRIYHTRSVNPLKVYETRENKHIFRAKKHIRKSKVLIEDYDISGRKTHP